jgi:hypothetical protein
MARTTSLQLTVAIATMASITCAFHLPSTSQPKSISKPFSPSSIETQLHAKPKKKTTSGAGFGGTTKTKAPQTRTVTGYTGSGTKVLADAANNFDRLAKLHGKQAIVDVYVRSPLNDVKTFWFVGKVIRHIPTGDSEEDEELDGAIYPTPAESILSQKRLILEYAKNQLRPQNLGGKYSYGLELWMAPGNSEMDVVQNKVCLEKVEGSTVDLREGFSVKDCGYNPEIYVGEEKEKGGLRVVRDEEGRPVKPAFELNDGN